MADFTMKRKKQKKKPKRSNENKANIQKHKQQFC